jgi:hypothetical protein
MAKTRKGDLKKQTQFFDGGIDVSSSFIYRYEYSCSFSQLKNKAISA